LRPVCNIGCAAAGHFLYSSKESNQRNDALFAAMLLKRMVPLRFSPSPAAAELAHRLDGCIIIRRESTMQLAA
jgi:hypothetical protein